jgi:hypothetical protein
MEKKLGRPPSHVEYKNVIYNSKEYTVGRVLLNDTLIEFVFDREDFPKINGRAWRCAAGKYIASCFTHEGKRKELYMHNIIMDRIGFPGKGAKETVDHINRNGFDNRKENLRAISQTEQNLNQSTKTRNVTLPAGCELKAEDIPKHIWYVHANGLHGDRFAIEFKTEGIVWKTTSSKKVSLVAKLEEAKEKLKVFYLQYPYLDPNNDITLKEREDLLHSFDAILSLSND